MNSPICVEETSMSKELNIWKCSPTQNSKQLSIKYWQYSGNELHEFTSLLRVIERSDKGYIEEYWDKYVGIVSYMGIPTTIASRATVEPLTIIPIQLEWEKIWNGDMMEGKNEIL